MGTRKNMRVFSEYRRKEQYHGGKDAKVKGNANVTERLKNRSNGTYSDFTKKCGLHYNGRSSSLSNYGVFRGKRISRKQV